MACGMYGFSRDAQLQTTVQDVVEITNGQPWQNSSQISLARTLCSGEEPNAIAR
jgi:hypothetical protein